MNLYLHQQHGPTFPFFRTNIYQLIWIAVVAIFFVTTSACNRTSASAVDNAATAQQPSVISLPADDLPVKNLRFSGTVQAVESHSILAPRLTGQASGSMVATRIVSSGARVRTGDVLVEFDRQKHMQNILDRQAEHDGFIQQIRRKQAEQAAARAADETGLKDAEVDVQTARVEMRKNDVIPPYQAEINRVNLIEAEARYKQLRETFDLKREAREADLRILEIQRDRAKLAVDYAGNNIEKMTILSPMDGLAVPYRIRKGTRLVDPQEGDEFTPGRSIMMIVDTEHMQVEAVVNQVDIAQVYIGQPAEIRLDAYPNLLFQGKVERIGPIGMAGASSRRVRNFSIFVSIDGSHPNLLPDLTASVDLQLVQAEDVPHD